LVCPRSDYMIGSRVTRQKRYDFRGFFE